VCQRADHTSRAATAAATAAASGFAGGDRRLAPGLGKQA
jgi:hypothetical protein